MQTMEEVDDNDEAATPPPPELSRMALAWQTLCALRGTAVPAESEAVWQLARSSADSRRALMAAFERTDFDAWTAMPLKAPAGASVPSLQAVAKAAGATDVQHRPRPLLINDLLRIAGHASSILALPAGFPVVFVQVYVRSV